MTNITVKQSNKYINRVLTSKARHQHSARVQDTKTIHYYTIFGSSVSSVNRGGNRFYQTNFGSSEIRTEQATEISVLDKFSSVLHFFRFDSRFSIKFTESLPQRQPAPSAMAMAGAGGHACGVDCRLAPCQRASSTVPRRLLLATQLIHQPLL